MIKFRYLLTGIVALSAFVAPQTLPALPSDYKATATIDSTVMIMGSTTKLNIEFAGHLQGNAHIYINPSDNPELEISAATSNGSSIKDLSNGRRQLQQSYNVQVFDSGLYVIPKIYCISGTDTLSPKSPALKVVPVPLDSLNIIMGENGAEDVTVHDYTDIADVKSQKWDSVPDWVEDYGWWILAAILLIGALLFCYFKWFRHGKVPLKPAKKKTPPYVLAVRQLTQLQEKKLWQRGAEKEYYTQLTDILRSYLYGRFGINAMEMTSDQIRKAMADCGQIGPEISLVEEILYNADFVKFAKARPAAEINERSFKAAREFVEVTKPVEMPQSAKAKAGEPKEGDTEKTQIATKAGNSEETQITNNQSEK